MDGITVEHDALRDRYLALLDGRPIGEAVYRDEDGARVFLHTEVLPAYEHHGVATELIREALVATQQAGLRPIGRCPMVGAFLAAHPEYA